MNSGHEIARTLRNMERVAAEPSQAEALRVAVDVIAAIARRDDAVARGDLVRIEIPLVVCANGVLVMEVDTAYASPVVSRSADDIARTMSERIEYVGTPYVIEAFAPSHRPAVAHIIGEVTPC